jgi:hypothetical protein
MGEKTRIPRAYIIWRNEGEISDNICKGLQEAAKTLFLAGTFIIRNVNMLYCMFSFFLRSLHGDH